MDEIVQEFLVESYENLDQLDQDLVALESAPTSRELLSSIFRTVHTIKGTSGFLGYANLERVSHTGENLLAELRDGARAMDQPTTDVLLALVDTLRAILGAIEAGGSDDYDVQPTIARIVALQEGAGPDAEDPTGTVGADDAAPRPGAGADGAAPGPDGEAGTPVPAGAGPADAGLSDTDPAATAEPGREVAAGTGPDTAPPGASTPVRRVIGRRRADGPDAPALPPVAEAPPVAPAGAPAVPAAPTAPTPAAAPAAGPAAPPPAAPAAGPAARDAEPVRHAVESAIRVDVALLDSLMRHVGELVLVRNQIDRLAERAQDVDLTRSAQRLSLIAGELQEGVMKTRMQPIEHVWNKMPRVVRDLAAALDRKVGLTMLGGETELDRSLLEAVKDPLTHLVRNAVDHGIEAPEERVAAGKPAQGQVTLRAYHAGGQVVVEIADDGRGIDPDAVAAGALARGLVTEQQVRAMSQQEIFHLLFLPGFSTARAVTNVSGRGVGMDVVRTKIEAIGGSVDVESTMGVGTTWRLRIPLTLAIMPALTVGCGSETYAISQSNLLELVAVSTSQLEHVGTSPVYRLRGELLPLVTLADVLELGTEPPESCVIAVLQADEQRFGLVVDRVLNNEEIVIKAISGRIKQIGLYSGATVLGDGVVALILDVQAIARRTLSGDTDAITRANAAAAQATDHAEGEQLLVVATSDDRRVAIPLATVTRLETMPTDRIERVGSREVVQYRGDLLPLVRLDRALGAFGQEDGAELEVVVLTVGDVSAAVVVAGIVDIVTDDPRRHSTLDDAGLTGSTVVHDRVTELLDPGELLRGQAIVPSHTAELVETR